MTQSYKMTIGELSRRSGCKAKTVRYYERIALIPPPPRTHGRYRLYSGDDVRRLTFVRRAHARFHARKDAYAADVDAEQKRSLQGGPRLGGAAHAAEIRAKIADLAAMERVLNKAVDCCASGKYPECPVIDALSTRVDAARPGN
jgi:MerR family transcriptional regulator, mercuric resistance operon regulatory protein